MKNNQETGISVAKPHCALAQGSKYRPPGQAEVQPQPGTPTTAPHLLTQRPEAKPRGHQPTQPPPGWIQETSVSFLTPQVPPVPKGKERFFTVPLKSQFHLTPFTNAECLVYRKGRLLKRKTTQQNQWSGMFYPKEEKLLLLLCSCFIRVAFWP